MAGIQAKPTQARLRELFDYDPETGILTNKVRRAKAAPGREAGSTRKDGYLSLSIDCLMGQLAHRVIWAWMTGEWPADQIDHADGDRRNNRWANLRLATAAQNNANKKTRRGKASCSIKGAFFHSETGKWRARIQVRGQQISLGLYDTPEDAGSAYLNAAQSIHGEFARGLHS